MEAFSTGEGEWRVSRRGEINGGFMELPALNVMRIMLSLMTSFGLALIVVKVVKGYGHLFPCYHDR